MPVHCQIVLGMRYEPAIVCSLSSNIEHMINKGNVGTVDHRVIHTSFLCERSARGNRHHTLTAPAATVQLTSPPCNKRQLCSSRCPTFGPSVNEQSYRRHYKALALPWPLTTSNCGNFPVSVLIHYLL